MQSIRVCRGGSDNTNIITRFCEIVDNRKDMRLDDWFLVKNRHTVQIADRRYIRPASEATLARDITDDPEIHRHATQFVMQVLKDKYRLGRIWQVFTVFVVTAQLWLIGLEVRLEITDLDDADIIFFHNAAMRPRAASLENKSQDERDNRPV